jgi:two-component system phosphate regulon response regulator PhoB/two-component system alkaline phosphatase synthesis response regulator PhoP
MKNILVAEDDRFLANAYRVKLTKAGFNVTIASDGAETVELLRKSIPDVLILDLVMPKKDGFTVLAEVKKDPVLSKVPVIVASNLGQKEDIDKAKSLGANDYIVKTDMSLNDIIEKIKKIAGA